MIYNFIIFLILLIMSYQDIKYGAISSKLQILLLIIIILASKNFVILGIVFIIYIFMIIIYRYIEQYIGGADIKIILILSVYYKVYMIYILLLTSCIGIWFSFLYKKNQIPFIPFLTVGVMCQILLK